MKSGCEKLVIRQGEPGQIGPVGTHYSYGEELKVKKATPYWVGLNIPNLRQGKMAK